MINKPHYVSNIQVALKDGINLIDYLLTFNQDSAAFNYLSSAQEYMDIQLTKLEKFNEQT